MSGNQAALRYWQRVRVLTLALLLLWLAVTVGVVVFARELSTISVWGWPVHFYLAAQGVTLVYLGITGAYALAMKRIDALSRMESRNES